MNWKSQVRFDLLPFADPGSNISYVDTGETLEASWKSRRRDQFAVFFLSNSNVLVQYKGGELAYDAFLASDAMADLPGLAQMMLQAMPHDIYVKTQAHLIEESGNIRDALELIESFISGDFLESTKLIFITGDAGTGKTEVLNNLIRVQAEKFLKGETSKLLLYVNAQGRALARLDEAIATELQDLRAYLTYHCIPTLVRNSILVPVIDGFDELLGVSGYDDAFSSLRRFIEQLNGRGAIVASARSAYYQQEFLRRASSTRLADTNISTQPIALQPWSDREFEDYILRRYDYSGSSYISSSEFTEYMREIFDRSQNRILKTKPFFVTKAASIILSGGKIEGRLLVSELVNEYLDRESTDKVLDRDRRPILNRDQLFVFIKFVCDEMWSQETRSIDLDTLKLIAGMTAEQCAIENLALDIFVEKAPIMAFFSPADGVDRIKFEHELLFSYFLSEVIADGFNSGEHKLYRVLMRGALPDGAADFFAQKSEVSSDFVRRIVGQVNVVCAMATSRVPQIKENAGAIEISVISFLAESGVSPQAVDIDIVGSSFSGVRFGRAHFRNCRFKDVIFNRTDMRQVKMEGCFIENTYFREILVSVGETNMNISTKKSSGEDFGSHFIGLRVSRENSVETIYRFDKMATILQECGVNIANIGGEYYKIKEEIVDLVSKVMRKFQNSNVLWVDDNENSSIRSNPHWPDIEERMRTAGIIVEADIFQHKGTYRKSIRRLILPEYVIGGLDRRSSVPNSITEFWTDIEGRYPG